MSVREYASSDVGAPQLTGEVGSLLAVLKAVLVNGYGAKVAAGWSVLFESTNVAVLKQGAGNQYVLRVDDSGPGAGGAREARIRGGEGASDVNTLINPFPTASQAANGWFARKSATLDATPRVWYIIADAATFYVSVQTGDQATLWVPWAFGSIASRVANDPGRTWISGRTTENTAAGRTTGDLLSPRQIGAVESGNALARHHVGNIGGILAGLHGDSAKSGFFTEWNDLDSSSRGVVHPNPAELSTYLSEVHIHTASPNTVRGTLRGLWHWVHNSNAVTDGAIIEGKGPMAGRMWRVRSPYVNMPPTRPSSALCFEISDTWPAP